MKRAPLIAVAAIATIILVTYGIWGDRALALLGLGPDPSRYLGYVEGETSLIGPPIAGRLIERPVERGQLVKKGDRLFVIDPVVAKAEVARAEATLAEARARYENMLTGKRQEEQDVIRGQRREIEASIALAETELIGPLAGLRNKADAVELVVQRRYNPEGKARLNIVPGLLAVILTMTMVMMTALAVTRERERGTMENLLAMPVRPIEVMIGKIAPYIVIGSVQVVVILLVSRLLFDVTIEGSVTLLSIGTALFITVNLAIGFTISTLTQNQLQAMQASFFMMLPSILLSGFMFPFRGMPVWAQWIGEALPATHFMRIVRGVMLKGADLGAVSGELVALVAMLLIVSTLAISRYKVTLD